MEELKKRSEIDDRFKWDMTDVYADEQKFSEDITVAREKMSLLKSYKGKITSDLETFLSCINLMSELELITERVYFYANQKYHEDMGNTKYQVMSDEAMTLLTDFSQASSFVQPELLKNDEEKINKYLQDARLKDYKQYFKDLFRQKEHILSEEIENVLAQTQKFSNSASDIFQIFNNADIDFPTIKDENGNDVKLSHSRFVVFLESKDKRVRKEAFEKLYETYGKVKNTLATVYLSSVKKDSFYAFVRKFQSSRQMFLDDGNIPECVYDNLIKSVNNNLGLLHRYVSLRKKVLKLEELHLYDLYTPLVENIGEDIDFSKAKEMVLEGLSPMGEEYLSLLKQGFENRWIDVYENIGKRSGAYSWSIYGVHPYVLLNYQNNLNNVFTIAHEMGHALHSYYSNTNQIYTNAEYKIFVAEVASTCNESLLIHDLINKSKNKKEKAYLINHFLEQFRGTLFRQTMFAEFENIIHKSIDNGESLSCDDLCREYYKLNEKYYGDNIIIDKEIELEWARIPHFYTAFYVYQYATGFSAAIALSKRILEEGEGAVEDYKGFLKGGSSLYPIDLLKIAGVDMSSTTPIDMALKVFEELLSELEELIG